MTAGEVLELRSEVAREHPRVRGLDGVVEGDTPFALDLFRELRADAPAGNLFVSPHSILTALAMALAGARGRTWDELAAVLRAAPGEGWHQARNALDLELGRERPTLEPLQPLRLEITNGLWAQVGLPVRREYLDLLARHHGAGVSLVDFATDAETARASINSWVAAATNERISELVPEGALHELTRLVLVNAIWFRANWIHQFDPERTADEAFHAPTGEVTVPTMHAGIRTGYGEGDGWKAVELPYAGEASMLVVVPDEGRFDEVAGRFDPTLLGQVRRSLRDHMVQLSMPRVEVRTQCSLPDVLRRLGIVEAFEAPTGDGGADFTGMVETRDLFLADAIHEAWVSIDETGTEAAAATALIMGVRSMPLPATLTIDRPYLVLVTDDATGTILFAGQVTDPST